MTLEVSVFVIFSLLETRVFLKKKEKELKISEINASMNSYFDYISP